MKMWSLLWKYFGSYENLYLDQALNVFSANLFFDLPKPWVLMPSAGRPRDGRYLASSSCWDFYQNLILPGDWRLLRHLSRIRKVKISRKFKIARKFKISRKFKITRKFNISRKLCHIFIWLHLICILSDAHRLILLGKLLSSAVSVSISTDGACVPSKPLAKRKKHPFLHTPFDRLSGDHLFDLSYKIISLSCAVWRKIFPRILPHVRPKGLMGSTGDYLVSEVNKTGQT